jgi:hypothetical protein
MKLLKTAVMAAFAAAALFPVSGVCAEKMSAVAVYVSGDVQVKRADAKDFAALKVNDSLSPGDSIKTAAGAKASLVSKGGAEIRINENSTFDIPGKNENANTFSLMAGQVWSRMLHKMAKLSVRTPSAVCAIRGTEADIEQKDIMTVKVYEGHVDLTNAAGKQSLHAGQVSTVSGTAAPAAPRAMSNSEKGNWQDGVTAKDINKYVDSMGGPGGEKKLKLKLDKDGKSKDVEVKLKKK